MRTAIAIFAKTPGFSEVKTRLAQVIGKDKAEEFYRLSVEVTTEVVAQACEKSFGALTPFWALAEEACINHPFWNRFNTMWTGSGDLGKRMQSVSDRLLLDYDQVMLIGTDIPQISSEILLEAISRMTACPNQCVIGPSLDGGFYLIGSSFQIPEKNWTDVTYSQEDTLQQLVLQLSNQHIECNYLERLGDVDHHQDLKDLRVALQNKKEALLPSQERLYEWLIG